MGESPWKPRKYSNTNQFVPTNKQEEIVLLLMLCEVMLLYFEIKELADHYKDWHNCYALNRMIRYHGSFLLDYRLKEKCLIN